MVSKLLENRAIIQNVLIRYTEGERQHHQMREYAHGEHTWYKRLNVDKGFENGICFTRFINDPWNLPYC